MKLQIVFLLSAIAVLASAASAQQDRAARPDSIASYADPTGHLIYEDYAAKGLAGGATIISLQVVNQYQCVPNPGNPPAGSLRVYCDSGTGKLTCLDSSGTSCFGGGGTLTGSGTTNFLPKWTGATALGNSLCDEGVTTASALTCTDTSGGVFVALATGTSPPTPTSVGTGGTMGFTEGTAPVWPAGVDAPYANLVNHCYSIINNGVDKGCVGVTGSPLSQFAATTSAQLRGIVSDESGTGAALFAGSPFLPSIQLCGTTTTCAKTVQSSAIIVYGTVPLSSGAPSTATITALPFTSTSSYVCTVTEASSATGNLLKVVNASASSTVITGPATVTDTINYICVGT